jgi:hypothetical protein
MADSLVAAYYDRLTRWNRLARAVGYGGGSATLTVHRGLADPRANGRPTSTRLHDLIVETVAVDRSPRVLDAGCGLGGTMLALRERWGGDYTGVTLSGAVSEAMTIRPTVHSMSSWRSSRSSTALIRRKAFGRSWLSSPLAAGLSLSMTCHRAMPIACVTLKRFAAAGPAPRSGRAIVISISSLNLDVSSSQIET